MPQNSRNKTRRLKGKKLNKKTKTRKEITDNLPAINESSSSQAISERD